MERLQEALRWHPESIDLPHKAVAYFAWRLGVEEQAMLGMMT